jgi:hypothetical protein
MGRVGISRLCRAGFMTDESSRPYRIEDLIRVRLRDLKTAACGIEVVYHARIAEEGGCYGRRHPHHDDPPASPCVRGCKPTGRILDKQHLGSDQPLALPALVFAVQRRLDLIGRRLRRCSPRRKRKFAS